MWGNNKCKGDETVKDVKHSWGWWESWSPRIWVFDKGHEEVFGQEETTGSWGGDARWQFQIESIVKIYKF